MNAASLINQTSGTWDYYTPDYLAEAARLTMGGIDLDPASSAKANETICALRYFTVEDDGLKQVWRAESVWMNHPFHRGEKPCPADTSKCVKKSCQKRGHHIDVEIPSNGDWINKLINAFENTCEEMGRDLIIQACCITYALTSESWFRPLKNFPICLLDGRTSYTTPDGTVADQNTKGSCVTYMGPHVDRFYASFKPFGTIHIPYENCILKS